MINCPDWERVPPQAFSIVTGFFPETKPRDDGIACRPLLVLQVLENKAGEVALRVAYGTTKVSFPQKANEDLIIQNSSFLDQCGLLKPTRFVLDPAQSVILRWNKDNFCLWKGCTHPRRGALPLELQKDVAWLLAQRLR